LNPTKVYLARIDEAFATGSEDKLLKELYSLARHITKNTEDATQFIMGHISTRLHRFQGLKKAKFSTWAFRVLKFRFIDWIREQQARRKREEVLVHGEATEDQSADEHLERLCNKGIPTLEKYGKRELQKARSRKALQMRRDGASNEEIAALLSFGKRAVKPSSVPAMLSRWKKDSNKFESIRIH